MVCQNVAQKLQKCCEGEEGDDEDRKPVCTYFGKSFGKIYLACTGTCTTFDRREGGSQKLSSIEYIQQAYYNTIDHIVPQWHSLPLSCRFLHRYHIICVQTTVLRRVLTLQHFPIITDVDAYAQVSVLLLKTAKIKFKKLTSLQQGVRAILIATNRKQQKSIWGESSCVKFQNRPYKASHSEYLQNVVFLIYICLPELCLINIRRRTQFVF